MTRAERDARWADLEAQEARISMRLAEAATFGNPNVSADTKQDYWEMWAERIARTYTAVAEPIVGTGREIFEKVSGWFRGWGVRG